MEFKKNFLNKNGVLIWYRLYVETEKKGTNELIYKKRKRVTDVQNQFFVTKGKKGLTNWEIGIYIYIVVV